MLCGFSKRGEGIIEARAQIMAWGGLHLTKQEAQEINV
jgi:hypothetical protein